MRRIEIHWTSGKHELPSVNGKKVQGSIAIMGNIPPQAARSGAGTIHHEMNNLELISLLREFLDLHCAVDAKSYVTYFDLAGAYYVFARNRGHELKMPGSRMIRGFMALMRHIALPGVGAAGFLMEECPGVGGVLTGLRLDTYPTKDAAAQRAFGFSDS
jgi:hypothetical protein